MKKIGVRLLLFAAGLFVYSMVFDEPQVVTVSGIFVLAGLGFIVFGPRR